MMFSNHQEVQTVGSKSYTDTSREDFHCGKYKKVDIVQKSREKRNSESLSDRGIFCGASIIADK